MKLRAILAGSLAGAGALLATAAFADAGLDRIMGRALFDRMWVQAPSSTQGDDGLGPLYNERGCALCHAGGGGARFLRNGDGSWSVHGAVARLGMPDGTIDPFYGQQIQTAAVTGLEPEGRLAFAAGTDGSLATSVTLSEGLPPLRAHISVRQAGPLFGRGGFDRIPDEAIRAQAAREAAADSGIHGRPRTIEIDGRERVGRFGWKARNIDLRHQTAEAFALDIGLSSPLMPRPYGDCTEAEKDCLAAPNGNSPGFDNQEISGEMLGLVAAYVASLPVHAAPADSRGAALFASTGCAACHVPSLPGRDGKPVPTFSDLLLHDMGPGLDDGMPEVGAASFEWRTAPLIDMANSKGLRRYLHDGRAPTVEAAVRAHGGEAANAAAAFAGLGADDRAALIAYVEGL
ncbi:CxxC motif-containing protein, DUF1111 family [Faunimonas pinastri]|uniref:CxxC motif-containing protein, DUF1111 family n=1 Tax=Faunimonas pinastri TaxID=1855383 RepID=A0A1H9LWF1_9HYPH|nr:di-heme oxidoredictase family protein [Faunimonas pinastri]SER15173.1 CxxC motif-containing protein, DUF1111 family [Faunimonas pinastri]